MTPLPHFRPLTAAFIAMAAAITGDAMAESAISPYGNQSHSYEAASEKRVADFPVNHSSGTMGVKLPVFNWKTGDYEMDISLTYHTGGLKAETPFSWVGEGWTLAGGGVISRSVIGLPDELKGTDIAGTPTFEYLKDAVNDSIDTGLDRFSYSFPDYSGVFYITGLGGAKPKIVNMSQNPVKFEITTDDSGSPLRFTATLPTGTQYIFDQREECSYIIEPVLPEDSLKYNRNFRYTSAWRLSAILPALSPDVIRFEYDTLKEWEVSDSPADVSFNSSREFGKYGNLNFASRHGATQSSFVRTIVHHNPRFLKRIHSRTAEVTFQMSAQTTRPPGSLKSLGKISIYNYAKKLIRECELTYALRKIGASPNLVSVKVTSDGHLYDYWEMDYSDRRTGRDFFGYPNGASNDAERNVFDHLLKINDHIKPTASVTAGLLSRLRDIYGNTTDIAYEPKSFDIGFLDQTGEPNRAPRKSPYGYTEIAPTPDCVNPDKPNSGKEYTLLDLPDLEWPTESAVGVRLKSITVTVPESGSVTKREFTYSSPFSTIDLSRVAPGAYIALSGCYYSKDDSVSTDLNIVEKEFQTATLCSRSRMPGFTAEDAEVYYGEVSETLTGWKKSEKSDTLRQITTYVYETGHCRHDHMPGGFLPDGGLPVKSKYLGVNNVKILEMSPYNDCENLFYPAPVPGYYRESFGASPLLKQCSRWGVRPDGTLVELKRETWEYAEVDTFTFETSRHVESLVFGVADQDGHNRIELYDSVGDFSTFIVTARSSRWLLTRSEVKEFLGGGTVSSATRNLYTGDPGAANLQRTVYGDDFVEATGYRFLEAVITEGSGSREQHIFRRGANQKAKTPVGNMLRDTAPAAILDEAVIVGNDTLISTSIYAINSSPSKYLYLQKSMRGIKGATPATTTTVEALSTCGRPRVITQNGRRTNIVWGYDGDCMTSVSTSGGPATRYTHIPLVGCTAVTTPDGVTTGYGYTAGKLTSLTGPDGSLLSEWRYSTATTVSQSGEITYNGTNGVEERLYYDSDTTLALVTRKINDAAGRTIRNIRVACGADSSRPDVVAVSDYDAFGRIQRSWAPYPVRNGEYSGSPEVECVEFYNDSRPWESTDYNDYSLARTILKTSAGAAMEGHHESQSVYANTTQPSGRCGNCRKYVMTPDGQRLVFTGYYAAGALGIVEQTDADGRVLLVFSDRKGRNILERRIVDGKYLDTYYIYDNFSQLVAVLQPAFVHPSRVQALSVDDDTVRKYAWLYRYNNKLQLVARRSPGCGWTTFGYDSRGEQTWNVDPEQALRGECTFWLRDNCGRVAVQGTAILTEKFRHYLSQQPVAIWSGTSANHPCGYSVNNNAGDLRVLKAIYYDSYSFLELPQFASMTQMSDLRNATRKGRECGSMTAVLVDSMAPEWMRSSEMLGEVLRYDPRGFVTETCRQALDGFIENTSTEFALDGLPMAKTVKITTSSGSVNTDRYVYTYDNARRMIRETASLAGSSETDITVNTFDAIGRQATMTPGDEKPVSYNYNIRGQLTGLSSTHFTQRLHYESGAKPCYSGHISAMEWSSPAMDGTWRYDYTYDSAGRLARADFSDSGRAVSGRDYSCQYILDPNSNLTEIHRNGLISEPARYGEVDNLKVSLDGNRPHTITDRASEVLLEKSHDFHDASHGGTLSPEMDYDLNGNLTHDLNRGISLITYNVLNLPERIEAGAGVPEYFAYNADGRKLGLYREAAQTPVSTSAQGQGISLPGSGITIPGFTPDSTGMVVPPRPPAITVDNNSRHDNYVGNHIYQYTRLKMTDAGNVRRISGKNYSVYRDYQGNVRALVRRDTIRQLAHYYPYGVPMAESKLMAAGDNRLYCDRPFHTEDGLDLYGCDWRMLLPTVGIFNSPDRLAEQTYDLSPYAYCGANPVCYTDPSGLSPVFNDQGNYLGATKEGPRTGPIYIYTGNKTLDFSKWTEAEMVAELGDDIKILDKSTGINLLGGSALSKIWTYLVSLFEGYRFGEHVFSLDDIANGNVLFDNSHIDENGNTANWHSKISRNLWYNKLIFYISGSNMYSYESTVENVVSSIIAHEWLGHCVLRFGDKTLDHANAYLHTIISNPLYQDTTDAYKSFVISQIMIYSIREFFYKKQELGK